ncbi:hypothetical protein E9228_002631 [Curtobacterium flaccumfaciens]|uniref:Gram-positive cocci surface proteins LPxTG domain-containing protein n=1 Tax=Curtobacterium salicis TaxID=1779862 RepID=A0ABX0T8X2_9MICO|nr:hypothetical protein [Curtobacterium sp. WW7]
MPVTGTTTDPGTPVTAVPAVGTDPAGTVRIAPAAQVTTRTTAAPVGTTVTGTGTSSGSTESDLATLAYTGAERPVLPALAALLLLLAGLGTMALRRRH